MGPRAPALPSASALRALRVRRPACAWLSCGLGHADTSRAARGEGPVTPWHPHLHACGSAACRGCPQLWWVPHPREHGCPALPCLLHCCARGGLLGASRRTGRASLPSSVRLCWQSWERNTLNPRCLPAPCPAHMGKSKAWGALLPLRQLRGVRRAAPPRSTPGRPCLLGMRLGCRCAQPLHSLEQGLLESCWHRAPEDSLSHHAGARTALILQLSPPLSACIPSPGHPPPEGSCCSAGLTAAWP